MFYFFCFLMLISGLISVANKRLSFFLFVLLILAFPTSTGMFSINYKFGIYYYDFYFLGLLLSIALGFSRRGGGRIGSEIFVIFFFVIAYFTPALISEGGNTYLMKDLRPFIFIAFFYLFWISFRHERIFNDYNESVYYFLIAVVMAAITNFFYLYYNSTNLNIMTDKFYQDNSYRYLDASSYFCSVFLIYFSLNHKDFRRYFLLSIFSVILALACILISNSRFLLLSVIVSLLYANSKNLRMFVFLGVVSVVFLSLFVMLSEYIGASRVLSALTYEEVASQLATRFYPALMIIRDMEWYHYIIGIGPGIPFYIPWFDYREIIDPYNSNLDSAYFTLYVKYGFLMLIPMTYFIRAIVMGCEREIKQSIGVFLLVMFFVSATFYHIYSIGLIVGCGFISMITAQKHMQAQKHQRLL